MDKEYSKEHLIKRISELSDENEKLRFELYDCRDRSDELRRVLVKMKDRVDCLKIKIEGIIK